MTTPDEIFQSCERQDAVMRMALGPTLDRATLLLGAILAVICVIVASLATLL